ncbi:MAG: DUF4404 family protein [Planctomycetota bacterium]|jgi:hypothetical protein
MPRKELLDHLGALHKELDHPDHAIDAEEQARLREVMQDIQRVLESDPEARPAPPAETEVEESWSVWFNDRARRFEAEYPALGTAAHRVADALGKLGI